MAAEFKAKGANIQLGPGVGVARVPLAGRNFEYLSGEDPFLGSVGTNLNDYDFYFSVVIFRPLKEFIN